MFGEEIVPICGRQLLKGRTHPLKVAADLRNHTLLHFDHPEGSIPWLSWSVWLESAGVPDLKPAGALRFSHYDQVVAAAVAGQGVALGRRPLVANLIADGSLVAPFKADSMTDRAYFIVRAPAAQARRDVDDFVAWLAIESAQLERAMVRKKTKVRAKKR